MEPLLVERIVAGLPAALSGLAEDRWAEAIMTTDTLPKAASRRMRLADGRSVAVAGIAKGAGMIRPNMATMIGFMVTDAAVAPAALQALVAAAADRSFNRSTIDGDISTNDSSCDPSHDCVTINADYRS